MRCVLVWIATAVAVARVCCGIEPALAEGDRDTATHFLFFSGADIWRNGLFSHAGFLWSYQGLDADSLVFKLLLNGGLYRYRSGNTEIVGRQEMGAVLPGWRWRRPGLEVTASASLSTVGKSYWTRAAAGWRVFDAVWLGPEFLSSGDDSYRQLRIGAHVTSLRLGRYEWSAGVGWVTDSDRRDGVYGRIGVLMRK